MKQIKDDTRITFMVVTLASEKKVPLSVVGKPKNPERFKLMNNTSPPLPYKNQANAWLDRKITLLWILNIFWSYHLRTEGDVNATFFLENCLDHTLSDEEKSNLPKRIFILFLTPNVTNTHQQDYMGMIVSIQVGYKANLLDNLLYIFYLEGGYLREYPKRKNKKRGFNGIDFGGKNHLIGSMIIMKNIWEDDEVKYSRVDGIKRCWRKANILPVSWECNINNDVGHSSVPISIKTLNKDNCDNNCNLLEFFSVKAKYSGVNVSREAHGLKGLLVSDCSFKNLKLDHWLKTGYK